MQKQKVRNEIYIGPVVQSIQSSDILASNGDILLLLPTSKRNLLIMDYVSQTLKNCNCISDQKIMCAVYHPILEVFIISTDKRLFIVNLQGQLISQPKIIQLFQAKFIVLLPMYDDGNQGVVHQRKDLILYVTSQFTYITQIQFNYERSMLKKRNLSDIRIQLCGQKKIILYQWITSINYLRQSSMLICWNQSQVYIFQLPQLRSKQPVMLFLFDKIIRSSDNKPNCFEICIKHRLLLVGFQFGSIKVYKFDDSKKYVCQLKGHQRECRSLYIPQSNQDLLYSSGLDNTIRIWDLIDLNQIYHIRLDLIVSQIYLLDENMIFGKAIDGRKSYIGKINIDLLTPFLMQEKSGRLIDLKSDGQWGISLYSNNFVECFLVQSKFTSAKQHNQKIQFPMKYGFLRSIFKLSNETYAICMQKGFSIIKLNHKQAQQPQFQLKRLVYNHSLISKNGNDKKNHDAFIQAIHQKLLGTFLFSTITDWKNIPISVNVTAVTLLLNVILPKWDVDQQGRPHKQKCDYVLLGSDRGHIYFIDINQRQQFYTRLHFHSSSVSAIQRIAYKNINKNRDQNQLNYMSLTVSHQLALWSLPQKQSPKLRLRLTIIAKFSIMKFIDHYIILGRNNGQLNILELQMQQDQQIVQFLQNKNKNEEGHLKAIIAVDYLKINNQNIFLTGGEDHTIKIWRQSQKQLLGEIKIFNMISDLIFNHRGIQIIVSHGANNQLTLLTCQKIQVLENVSRKIQYYKHQNSEQSKFVHINFKQLMQPEQLNLYNSPFKSFITPSTSRVTNQLQKLPYPNISYKQLSNKIQAEKFLKKQSPILPSFQKSSQRTSLIKGRRYKSKSIVSDFDEQSLIMNNSFLPTISKKKDIYQSDLKQFLRGHSFSLAGKKRY